MHVQSVPLEVLFAFKHVVASWVWALELSLIGFATKVSVQVFVQQVSARYMAQAPFISKLRVANANQAYGLIEHERESISASRLLANDAVARGQRGRPGTSLLLQ